MHHLHSQHSEKGPTVTLVMLLNHFPTIAHFYIYWTLIQSHAAAKVIYDHKVKAALRETEFLEKLQVLITCHVFSICYI